MQSGVKPTGGQAPVKIYNAVYSSVQVYECMVRGIAVMRRRSDAYVNATQILKVAGIDKGRRTKILEKEILPGKHEIVQGGYGKYQGTWIPLERGREVASSYGVAPLLAPLFDFMPHPQSLGGLPGGLVAAAAGPSRPLSAASFTNAGGQTLPNGLAPPPILPGSALRLLNQGRAQGLFTPSMSTLALVPAVSRPPSQPDGTLSFGYSQESPFSYSTSETPPPGSQGIKRSHSEMEFANPQSPAPPSHPSTTLAAPVDIQPSHGSRSSSVAPYLNGVDGHTAPKRPRTDAYHAHHGSLGAVSHHHFPSASRGATPLPNGSAHAEKLPTSNGAQKDGLADLEAYPLRLASKSLIVRGMDATAPLKDPRLAAIVSDIISTDDPLVVLSGLRRDPSDDAPPSALDVDIILDEHGHTALHLAASMARMETVQALLGCGADVHRGNYNGETPLMRACLSKHNHDQSTFPRLVGLLNESIRTLDTSNRTVLHHIVAMAGVKDRAAVARYYLDGILTWIVKRQKGDFKSIIDRQDEHGDTTLNIAARVGSRGFVKILLDVGANRTLPNKLGLRPGDFGVETEELASTTRTDDLFHTLRSAPSIPLQKSQDVITNVTNLINSLNSEFIQELKVKQDTLDVTQAHLRAATRELAEQRKQIQLCQSRCNEFDQVSQRVRNLAKAIADEDKFDWSGRDSVDRRDGSNSNTSDHRQQEFIFPAVIQGAHAPPSRLDEPPPIPAENSMAALVRLRRLKRWQDRTEQLIHERVKTLQGVSLTKELQAKKLVSICSNVSLDKVDELLEDLLSSFESERQGVDVARAAGFLQKVRDGVV